MKYTYLMIYISGFLSSLIVRIIIEAISGNSFIISEIMVFLLLITLVVFSCIVYEKYYKKSLYRKLYAKGYKMGYSAGTEKKIVHQIVIPLTEKGGYDEKRTYEALESRASRVNSED